MGPNNLLNDCRSKHTSLQSVFYIYLDKLTSARTLAALGSLFIKANSPK